MFAYQRSNVAELNRIARELMVESDRVAGPEMHRIGVGESRGPKPKLVMLGDWPPLGPVGPAWPCELRWNATLPCFTGLDENRPRSTSGSATALEQLHAGNVGLAAAWYRDPHGRIHTEPDRDWTLSRAVEGWASDIEAGRDAALFAYQRSNVAELNRLAREVMVDSGCVSAPRCTAWR